MTSLLPLSKLNKVLVHQVHEWGEWIGFETRNKYEILSETNQPIAFAAEQQKGFFGFFMRQYLGHWRKFHVHFFDNSRQLYMVAFHPFRFLFQRIELRDASGNYLGALQQRFAILSKRFDVQNEKGLVLMEIASPLWTPWTFSFMHQKKKVAEVKKKWSGMLAEAFTDKDKFMVSFDDPTLDERERNIVTASAVFIDLLYFERKASS